MLFRSFWPRPSHGAATASVAAQLLHAASMPRHRGLCAPTQVRGGLRARRTNGVTSRRLRVCRARRGLTAHHGLEPRGSDTKCWCSTSAAPSSSSLAQTKVEEGAHYFSGAQTPAAQTAPRRTNGASAARTASSIFCSSNCGGHIPHSRSVHGGIYTRAHTHDPATTPATNSTH